MSPAPAIVYPLLKRTLDVALSALGLLLLFPLGLGIAALIRLSDGGPVFFGQMRVGRFGRLFRIWKFRSMKVDAEKNGAGLTQDADPRITRVGRWLRKTKLDELPQLWNVLIGTMSLVGPRPELPRYVARYTPAQREILQYKPGITDLATLRFRNEEDLLRGAPDLESFYLRYCLPKKIELNRRYARHAGPVQDLWLIIRTVCPRWLGMLALYTLLLILGLWLALGLRGDFVFNPAGLAQFGRCVPWVLVPQLLFLVWLGECRGMLSCFSLPELWRTFAALGLALLVQLGLAMGRMAPGALAPAALIIDFLAACLLVCGTRAALRVWREQRWAGTACSEPVRRIAIVGAGQLGIDLVLRLQRQSRPGPQVVALFDDDPQTWGQHPHHVPVVGMPECLLNREWAANLDEVILSLPRDQTRRMDEIRRMLQPLPLTVTVASGWPAVPASA